MGQPLSALVSASADEAVIFADAAHPTHAVRPVGCWAPKEVPVAVEQSSGRDRLNIHGAIDLETGQTIIKDVLTVDALSYLVGATAQPTCTGPLELIAATTHWLSPGCTDLLRPAHDGVRSSLSRR